MNETPENLKPSLQLIRSIVYSGALTFILIVLINSQYLIDQNLYGAIAFFGVLLGGLEAYFTSKYLTLHFKKNSKSKIHRLSHHFINHLFYPIIGFFALCLFLLVQSNLALSYTLIFINFLLITSYLYYLPYHLIYDHPSKKVSIDFEVKIDFILYIYKFFSFFIVNLALFTFYSQSRISLIYLSLMLFSIAFLYLFFHLFRKRTYSSLNLFMCFLFVVIYTFFAVTVKTNLVNVNAMISTLFFYLTSAIFYHKVDGNFNYKVLIEYSAIGLIVSIIIFSIR